MERKKYSKPYLVSEIFNPQEFCAPCEKPYPSVTTLSGWSDSEYFTYIDLNGDGSYQVGERFYPSTGVSTYPSGIPDQDTKDAVGIYYFTMAGGTQNNHGLNANQAYADHKVGNEKYFLETIATKRIQIIDNAAYLKTVS